VGPRSLLVVVKVLVVELGADVHAQMHEGAVALHCAAQQGHAVVVKALVQLGVDMDVLTRRWSFGAGCRHRQGPHSSRSVAHRLRRHPRSAQSGHAGAALPQHAARVRAVRGIGGGGGRASAQVWGAAQVPARSAATVLQHGVPGAALGGGAQGAVQQPGGAPVRRAPAEEEL
jgi:hypothetical protein